MTIILNKVDETDNELEQKSTVSLVGNVSVNILIAGTLDTVALEILGFFKWIM